MGSPKDSGARKGPSKDRTSWKLYILVCYGAGPSKFPGETWVVVESYVEFLVPGAAGSSQV